MIENIRLAAAMVLLVLGVFLMVTAVIGLIRLPDVYCRMHATGKCDTLGLGLILSGLIVYQGADLVSVKMLFIILFVLLTSPVSTHALFRAAIAGGHKMWTKEGWKLWSKEGRE